MQPEPLDDCLPFAGDPDQEAKLLALLRGPKIGPDGKIIGGTYDGMTPADVIADRDAFNRACGL